MSCSLAVSLLGLISVFIAYWSVACKLFYPSNLTSFLVFNIPLTDCQSTFHLLQKRHWLLGKYRKTCHTHVFMWKHSLNITLIDKYSIGFIWIFMCWSIFEYILFWQLHTSLYGSALNCVLCWLHGFIYSVLICVILFNFCCEWCLASQIYSSFTKFNCILKNWFAEV